MTYIYIESNIDSWVKRTVPNLSPDVTGDTECWRIADLIKKTSPRQRLNCSLSYGTWRKPPSNSPNVISATHPCTLSQESRCSPQHKPIRTAIPKKQFRVREEVIKIWPPDPDSQEVFFKKTFLGIWIWWLYFCDFFTYLELFLRDSSPNWFMLWTTSRFSR